MDRKISLSLLGRIFLLAALMLSACAGPTKTPTETPQAVTLTPYPTTTPSDTQSPPPGVLPATAAPTGTSVPQAPSQLPQPVVDDPNFVMICESNKEIDFNETLKTTPFYIQGQVILTGPAGKFPGTIKNLAAAGIDLTPVILCTLSIPDSIPNPNPNGNTYQKEPTREGLDARFPFLGEDPTKPAVEGNRLAMNLYQFDYPVTLTMTLQMLEQQQIDLKPPDRIYADPNYLTGNLANTACGRPFGVEGSPFGVEGSPFGVEGSPFGVEGSPYGGMGLNADPGSFWQQWAFEHVGLNQIPGDVKEGEGVRIGVFDTSPYDTNPGVSTTTFTETQITPELNLTVHYPIQLPGLDTTIALNIMDHGLFVSSLAHAFAPQSQVHLYRVLNNAGCGDLFRLNVAMLKFLSEDWSNNRLTQPAVINLSLGVRKPRKLHPNQPVIATAEADEIGDMDAAVQAAYELAMDDPSIESLETVVQLAHQAGMLIVSAAGNDSVIDNPPLANMPLPMELPADYPFVIGVSASTITDGPACYSNMGDVAAPGADATLDNDSRNNHICVSQAASCPVSDSTPPNDPSACAYGVIGLSTVSPSRYAYWVGTSFATPMVSGLAALVYQHSGNAGDTWTKVTTQVNPTLARSYGSGLISVQKALGP
jgi:subtilisin family serine protease